MSLDSPYKVHIHVPTFQENTGHLTCAQVGSLMQLVMYCCQHGSIINDEKRLAWVSNCSRTHWRRHLAQTVLPFFKEVGPNLEIDQSKILVNIPFGSKDEWNRLVAHVSETRAALTIGMKRQIFERDGYRCVYCGEDVSKIKPHCDHIIPVARYGTNAPDNLATSCTPCNLSKGNRTPDEWRAGA